MKLLELTLFPDIFKRLLNTDKCFFILVVMLEKKKIFKLLKMLTVLSTLHWVLISLIAVSFSSFWFCHCFWPCQVVRRRIIGEGIRVDGRRLDEVRPLYCEAGNLPVLHGSSIFSRGDTQVSN